MEQLEFSIIGIDSEEHICLPMFEGAHLTPRLPRWGIILKVACILWKTYGCYVGPSLDGGTLGVTDDAFVLSLLGKRVHIETFMWEYLLFIQSFFRSMLFSRFRLSPDGFLGFGIHILKL